MNPPAVNSFLGAGIVVLATLLTPLAVQAQNTNITFQNGRINLNQTYQQGTSNTNTTSQTGLININRTIQLGGNTGKPIGSLGRFNSSWAAPGRSFQGTGFDHGDDAHGHGQRHGEARRDHPHGRERQ